MDRGDLTDSYPRISAAPFPEETDNGLLAKPIASDPVIPARVAAKTKKREDPIPLLAFLFGRTEKEDPPLPFLSADPFPCGLWRAFSSF